MLWIRSLIQLRMKAHALNLHVLSNVTECGFAFMLTNIDDLFRSSVNNLMIVAQGYNPCPGSSKKCKIYTLDLMVIANHFRTLTR